MSILFIIYLILKERKQDQDEIDDIMYSLVDDEDASEDEEIKQEEDNEDTAFFEDFQRSHQTDSGKEGKH